MAEDLREAIEGAFKEVEDAAEGEEKASETPESGADKPAAEPAPKDPGVVAQDPSDESKKDPSKDPEAKAAPEVKEPEQPAEQPAVRSRRAPGTWRPALREKWGSLEPDVQAEILRREAEIARGLSESTNSRKFQEEFTRTVAPYQSVIAAEGGNAMKFVNDLMVTAASLYHGTSAQKVNVVAGLIKNFGVNLEELDQVLATNKPLMTNASAAPNDVSALVRAEIQRNLAPILRGQQMSEQEAQQQVSQELESFSSDPNNEFFDDVRETMADLLEVAARRGQKMDLSTAYNRATMMHPDIAKVIEDRNLRKRATEVSATAQAARRKSVSVVGAPAKAAGEAKPETLRGDIEAAIAQAEGS